MFCSEQLEIACNFTNFNTIETKQNKTQQQQNKNNNNNNNNIIFKDSNIFLAHDVKTELIYIFQIFP